MFILIDKFTFANGIISPQNKNYVIFLIIDFMNDCIGKLFPSFVLMRTGLVGRRRGEGVVLETRRDKKTSAMKSKTIMYINGMEMQIGVI